MRIGDIFDTKYEIVELLGKGAFGKVYLAKNLNLDTLWAIKQIDMRHSKQDYFAEANVLKHLEHISLPRIIDVQTIDGYLYLVMDYISGESLKDRMSAGGKFTEEQIYKWALEIANVLKYLHSEKEKPIIFHDLKPSNIMINDKNRVKVIDFGIAVDTTNMSENVRSNGYTAAYAAPEQFLGNEVDVRTDIYNFGCTIFHLLAGKVPEIEGFTGFEMFDFSQKFRREKIDFKKHKVSIGFAKIINKCMSYHFSDRYQSAEELVNDLRNIHKYNQKYKLRLLVKRLGIAISSSLLVTSMLLVVYGVNKMDLERYEDYKDLIFEAHEMRSQEDFENALRSIDSAILLISESYEAYEEKALILYESEKYHQTLDFIENNLFARFAQDLISPEIYFVLGEVYLSLDDLDGAIKNFELAINMKDDARYYAKLTYAYGKAGEFELAQEVIDRGELIGILNDYINLLQGELFVEMKQYQKAEEALQFELEIVEDIELKEKTYQTLVDIYEQHPETFENGIEMRIKYCEEALKNQNIMNKEIYLEKLAKAYFDKSYVLDYQTDEYYDSLTSSKLNYEKALLLGFNDVNIQKNLGVVNHYLGNFEESEKIFRLLLKYDSKNFDALYELTLLLIDVENTKTNGIRNYQKAYQAYKDAEVAAETDREKMRLNVLKELMDDLKEKGWF